MGYYIYTTHDPPRVLTHVLRSLHPTCKRYPRHLHRQSQKLVSRPLNAVEPALIIYRWHAGEKQGAAAEERLLR